MYHYTASNRNQTILPQVYGIDNSVRALHLVIGGAHGVGVLGLEIRSVRAEVNLDRKATVGARVGIFTVIFGISSSIRSNFASSSRVASLLQFGFQRLASFSYR